MPGKLHRPQEETRIEQMQNRVFNPTDILIHIHPIGDIFGRGGLRGMRRGKAGKIPRGINECVHGVGFTQSRFPAGGAGTIAPCRVAIQRISRFVKADIIGQDHGQVFFFLGHHAAGIAMYNGDRAAPIALARQAPIAQPVIGNALAPALCFGEGNRGIHGLLPGGHVEPGEVVGPFHFFRFRGHKRQIRNRRVIIERKKCINHGQVIFASEIQIALIMRRAGENCSGAVIHQNKIRDPNGQSPVRV